MALILRHCLPTPSTKVLNSINLPCLKRLEVAGFLEYCACFLRQITINTSTVVLLDLKCPNISEQDVHKLFTAFRSHLFTTSDSAPIAQALKFTWRDSVDFKIDIWSVKWDTKVRDPRSPDIKFVFSGDSIGSRTICPLDLMWTCFVALASSRLRSFRISDGHINGWNEKVWRNVARMAPKLQTLAPGLACSLWSFARPYAHPMGRIERRKTATSLDCHILSLRFHAAQRC
ncbi:hypothetical protein BD779DRAFT_552283 [Infundibulicybe gibba]|nr:hypothetical protein BD779DRAFT_552283 [Infundibulicybe gibba]